MYKYNYDGIFCELTISIEDQLSIQDLISRQNCLLDNGNIEAWLETWADDGILEATYGRATGKHELKELMTNLYEDFMSDKKHITSNLVIDGNESTASCSSYLTVFEAKKTPSVVASGTYYDEFKKINGKWKFVLRHLKIDLVDENKN